LDINQTSKASYTLGERTITDTAFATPDGIMPPKALVNIEQQSPLKLDETRYILLNPGEIFEVYLEPENWDTTIDIPYPGHTKTLRKFRQYGYLSIHGLFTDVEKYI
jgi:hypothetical protein